MNIAGIAHRRDGTKIRVHMVNLSYSGCKLVTDQPLIIGEEVRLAMPRLPLITAEVRWTTGEEAGLRYVGSSEADDRQTEICT